jgi:enoyl-CoA hydratase/carnithine racemase
VPIESARAGCFPGHAIRWAQRFAERPVAALVAAKKSIREGLQLSLRDALAREREIFLDLLATSDLARRPADR